MPQSFLASLAEQTEALREQGLFKSERLITGPQQADIDVRMNGGSKHVLNLCANNYLGLANHPDVIAAAHKALDEFGYGMASVRFICGTQTIHKELEARISAFLGTEDTILYPSCFDANGGLFETILGPDDAVISDAPSTTTWGTFAPNSSQPMPMPSSSSPMACFRWTGRSPTFQRFAHWPRNSIPSR
jgi:glycine C-acetyltransferase